MDRRTLLAAALGTAGAGTALGWSRVAQQNSGGVEGRRIAPAPAPRRLVDPPTNLDGSLAQVPIGAGGFVTGLDISADGSRFVCRTDVANSYVRNASDDYWRPIFSPASLLTADLEAVAKAKDKIDARGVAGICLAPSNPDVIYASYLGYIWKSLDGGRTMRRTALEQKRMFSNSGPQRLFNPTIAVDPRDPAVVLVGTWGDGVWYTTDGGTRWQAAWVPESGKWFDGQPGTSLVAFASGIRDQVHVFVNGVGLFRSGTGPGGQFERLSGGPSYCSNLVPAPDGSVFLCEQTSAYQGGRVWRHHPQRGWTSAQPEREGLTLALDPHKAGHALLIEANGFVMETNDDCATFRVLDLGKFSKNGNEIGWMGGLRRFFPAEARFDPKKRDRLWIAQGVGVASTATDRGSIDLQDWSAGIEELCASSVLCVPGGKTFFSAWDKPFWRIDSEAAYVNDFRYPLRAGKEHDTDLVAFASSLDFAPEDPRFMVGVVAPSEKSAPGFSEDGGDTWRVFAGEPAEGWGYGGCIAAASKRNFVLLPSNNAVGQYTLDGGKSWSPIRLDGTNPTGGFSNAYFVARKNLAADKTRPGAFGLVYTTIRNDEYAEPLGGFWLTLDGGRTWKQQLRGVVNTGRTDPQSALGQGRDARQFWQCQLDYVPGRSRELVYTPHSDFAADPLFWSQDDGASWAELHKDVRNVRCFAFGKAASPGSRPSLCFWGEVKGRAGLYVSTDWFQSAPRFITDQPSDKLATIKCMGGDMDRFGRFYLGTDCAGWIRVDLGT